ncbi:MAG: hypothetical protein ACXVP8_08515 [Actinomycetota bacterium]
MSVQQSEPLHERERQQVTNALSEENAKQWLIGAAGVWLLVRLAEMRQQRALLRAMGAR